MRVFVFDFLAYAENLMHLAEGKKLPWPLPRRHFNPEVARRTYEDHLAAWDELDRLGYDGVCFNEHHTSPYGLMNSPNIMAAAAAQRTKNLKLYIAGNLLPIHDPLRLAEEIAMLDCMSNGRIISGFARGIPREHNVYDVPLNESRARFEEAWEIIRRAWTEEVFSYEGNFWSYHNVAIWPRPFQQPHPPVWCPATSKETIEFAARNNMPITPGGVSPELREDATRYYVQCMRENGYEVTPEHLVIGAGVYIADSKARAVQEYAPYYLYFRQTLFSHGNLSDLNVLQQFGYVSASSRDYARPEARGVRPIAESSIADVEREADHMPWGTPDEIAERIIHDADISGANAVMVHMNWGAMPQEMFLEQIQRFGTEILPKLQAHEVKTVPFG